MMKMRVIVYDKCKYDADSNEVAKVDYDVDDWEVVKRSDSEVYNMGFDCVDECGEYLILTIEGETSTFRNSHVDLFRM